MDWGLIVTATSMGIGAVAWLVRLEGRVTTNEQLSAQRFAEVIKQQDRLESKLDDLTDYLLRKNGDKRV